MVAVVIRYPQVPLIILGLTAIFIFLAARYFAASNRFLALASAFAFLISAGYLMFEGRILSPFEGRIASDLWQQFDLLAEFFDRNDPGAHLMSLVVLTLSIAGSLFNVSYMARESRLLAFYPLYLFLVCGLVGMLYSPDLVNVYLFCEMMSISAYALVAFRRNELDAIEAGYKYLIMGSVASVIMLLGIALIYFSAGTLELNNFPTTPSVMVQIGGLLIFSGFSLKSAIVPLHAWLPDAHGKAPGSVSAVLSGILVEVALYIMLKIGLSLGISPLMLGTTLLILSALNILVGNLMGTAQSNIKRMLGYSTIAQMGYIVLAIGIGLRNGSMQAIQTGLFILVAHACAKGLAFLSAADFYRRSDLHEVRDLRFTKGILMSSRLSLVLAALSLAAIPPFPGFTGKWMVLTSLFQTDDPLRFPVTIVLLLGSLIAFGYYLPLLVNLLASVSREHAQDISPGEKGSAFWTSLPLALLALFLVLITLFPQVLLNEVALVAEFLLERIN